MYVLCAVYVTFIVPVFAMSRAAASHRKSKTTRNMNQNFGSRGLLFGLLLPLHLVDAICRCIPSFAIGNRLRNF